MRKLPQETRAEIIAALTVNPNAHKVAAQVGVSPSTVARLAKKAGIALPNSGNPGLPAEVRAKIITALTVNPNADKAAAQVGVSRSAVARLAKRAGIALASRGNPGLPAEVRAEIITALTVNPNAHKVAPQFGVSPSAVARLAKEAGIALTARRGRPGLPAEMCAEIITALAVSPNAHKVAAQFGVSRSAVARLAKESGITLRRAVTLNAMVRALEQARRAGDRTRITALIAAAPTEVLPRVLEHLREKATASHNSRFRTRADARKRLTVTYV